MDGEKRNKAAFYDLDGTLLSCKLVTTDAYYARNDRSIFQSIYQFAKVLLSVPLFLGLDLYSRTLFNVFFFRAYPACIETGSSDLPTISSRSR